MAFARNIAGFCDIYSRTVRRAVSTGAGVAATTVLYWRGSRLAGILMMPYLAWTAFASSLNFAIWRMNR